MAKEIKVVWSANALKEHQQIIAFLELVWNEKIIQKFIEETNAVVEKIKSHPFTFSHAEENKIYKRKLNRFITLYFMVEQHQIILLSFFDGRQNPENLLKDNF